MRKIKEIQELRKIQVGILKYVHDTCEKNGLVYFLCAGTLIGAVRHKGYIPWDDDIDIMMPRKDYGKLLKLIDSDKSSPFRTVTYRNCPELGRAFAKVSDSRTLLLQKDFYRVKGLGVNIDIFPYDGLSGSKEEVMAAFRKTQVLRKYLFLLTRNTDSPTKRMPKWRLPFVFLICFYTDAISKKYSVEKSEKVVCFTAVISGETEIMDKDIFKKRVLTDFENERLYMPEKYHEYLTLHYGDYMKLPPVSQRRNKHGIIAWWK